jgi:hypothetical protein
MEMVISELCDTLFSLFSKYKRRLMISPCSLCVCVTPLSTMEPEEKTVATQRLDKHVPRANNQSIVKGK